MRRRSMLCVALVALLVASACSGGTPDAAPSSTPTVRSTSPVAEVPLIEAPIVAVVVAPQEGRERVLERLRDLAEQGDGVAWWIAEATTSALVGDLAGRFVDRGADLVCVVGAGQEETVGLLARQVPSGRFCVGPATAPEEAVANVLYVDARVQETAYLAGALAGLVDPRGRAGMVTGRSIYRSSRQQTAFEAGLDAVGAPPQVTVTGPVTDEDAARAAIDAQFDTQIGVVFGSTGPLDVTLLDAAVERAGQRAVPDEEATEETIPPPTGVVVGDAVVTDEELPDEVLAIVRLFPERIVLPAVDRLLGVWEPGRATVGLTEGAVSIDLAATPLSAPHVDDLNRLRGEIAAGDRTPG